MVERIVGAFFFVGGIVEILITMELYAWSPGGPRVIIIPESAWLMVVAVGFWILAEVKGQRRDVERRHLEARAQDALARRDQESPTAYTYSAQRTRDRMGGVRPGD